MLGVKHSEIQGGLQVWLHQVFREEEIIFSPCSVAQSPRAVTSHRPGTCLLQQAHLSLQDCLPGISNIPQLHNVYGN